MMHPDTMRRLDRLAGIPLCFLLTVLARVGRSIRPGRAPDSEPRSVLFIELAEMGAMVLASPAIAHLKATHPESRIYFLVFSNVAPGVTVLGLVPDEHVLTIDPRSLFTLVRDVSKFFFAARRLRIDTTINLEAFTRLSTILAFLSGATRRVGYHRFTSEGLYTGHLVTHAVPYNHHVHAARSFMALVAAIDEPVSDVPMAKFPSPGNVVLPRVQLGPTARANAWKLLRQERPAIDEGDPLVLVNPNASKLISIRKWPLEYYADLVARLCQHPRVTIGLTGLPSEREDTAFIMERVRSDRVINLAGKTTLAELIALFDVAVLLITNDSGPAHFAALTGIDVLVFFGPETPALYKPLTDRCTVLYSDFACSPCVSASNQRVSPCNHNRCLTTIDVDTAYGEAVRILKRRSAGALDETGPLTTVTRPT